MKVLVVEDEPKVARLIARGLAEEGHSVALSGSGPDALARVEAEPYDVVVLDGMLPGLDGWTVCKRLRETHPRLGILMLSARGELRDRVDGLAAGADDYLPKPFAFEELLLRLGALERRIGGGAPLDPGALRLDPLRQTLSAGDQEVSLTPRELALMSVFLAHPDAPLTRERLAAEAWDTVFDTGTNQVDVYVAYLRKKLAALGQAERLQTERGVGYRLVPARP